MPNFTDIRSVVSELHRSDGQGTSPTRFNLVHFAYQTCLVHWM